MHFETLQTENHSLHYIRSMYNVHINAGLVRYFRFSKHSKWLTIDMLYRTFEIESMISTTKLSLYYTTHYSLIIHSLNKWTKWPMTNEHIDHECKMIQNSNAMWNLPFSKIDWRKRMFLIVSIKLNAKVSEWNWSDVM